MVIPSKTDAIYPGETAAPVQVLKLAEAWGAAAHLLKPGAKQSPLSRAPFRFVAVHAIELYLNAYLLHVGYEPLSVRKLKHDLAGRTERAIQSGLILRKRTERHLGELAEGREYLKTRYGAESLTDGHAITRITATLKELAEKVSKRVTSLPPGTS